MGETEGEIRETGSDAAQFGSTQWSVVLAAGAGSSPQSREALETLCRRYWYPLYAYVYHRVRTPDEAEELVQEFFARLLEKKVLAVAEPSRGRFRSFLLTALHNFLVNEWEKISAKKRGGGRKRISLDFSDTQSRVCTPTSREITPEKLFERQWAIALLSRTLQRLHDEFAQAGKADRFEALVPFLMGRNAPVTYAQAAQRLDMSEDAAMVAAHRMRRRFRELLRAEIVDTVTRPEDVDDEIRSLFASLSDS
jgi:RNA polymerase sigma-70 factor (ECF subfamily)